MDKIIEALLKLLPLALLFEKTGMGPEISVSLAAILNATLIYGLVALYQYLVNHYKNSKAARDLAPYFDCRQVQASRALFIPTQFQNQSPTREEEPKFSHKYVSKSRLIPFFIKTAFNEKKESDKFYLVLADSGMGKTTFMINLYVKYTSFFHFRRKYQMRLFPFGDTRILDQIKAIEKKAVKDTILLLDAFDEDKKLIPPAVPDGLSDDERFRRRLDEIIEVVRDFREVVITSRTQYFPGQEDQPYELKIPRFDEKGFHTLAKLYLSPFDDREIKRYLNKKYGRLKFWNRKKKRIATTIVENSPKLMVRPMLLGYIDYLVDDTNLEFKNTWQIYETLIQKWIEREANKRKYQIHDREKFKQDLDQFSRLVAIEIYRQRQQTNLLSLKKEAALEIARKNHLDLCDYEITGQSLLTRDIEGSWKFAHKSIFEFLIAKEAVRDLAFMKQIDFAGMDVARQFYNELLPEFVKIKGGTFSMGSPEDEINRSTDEIQHDVKINDFYMAKHTVTLGQFEIFMLESSYRTDADKDGGSYLWNGKEWKKKSGVNWRCDAKGEVQKDKRHPVIHASWNDACEYGKWLSQKYHATFRLPTEAEWEYACRAGTGTPFNTGENLTTDQANYDGNYPYKNFPKGQYLQKTTPVGSHPPNAWGLYDMHGNVWEWCGDWYDEKYYAACNQQGIVTNPTGPGTGSYRVIRGGSWLSEAQYCRAASRNSHRPGNRDVSIGFRLVFVPQSVGSSSDFSSE